MYRNTEIKNCWFIEKPKVPSIAITNHAYMMSMAYIDECDKEIGWLCHVSYIDETFVIDECFLPKQQVSGATCEFSEEGLSEIMTEILNDKDKGIEYYNNIRCWAHSHVNMAARPSGQDSKQILEWKDSDYQIMLIANKRGEFYAEFYDFKNKVAFNNLSVELFNPDKKYYKECASAEIKEKVSTYKPPIVPNSGNIKYFDDMDDLETYCKNMNAQWQNSNANLRQMDNVKLQQINNANLQPTNPVKTGTKKNNPTKDFCFELYKISRQNREPVDHLNLIYALCDEENLDSLNPKIKNMLGKLSNDDRHFILEDMYYSEDVLYAVEEIITDAYLRPQTIKALDRGAYSQWFDKILRPQVKDVLGDEEQEILKNILPAFIDSENDMDDIFETIYDNGNDLSDDEIDEIND